MMHGFESTLCQGSGGSLLALICPIAIWAVLVIFLLALLAAAADGIKRLRRLHQIPCDRCLYHSGNAHLRCPVHPCSAFSEAAIGCRDYTPKPRDFEGALLRSTPVPSALQSQTRHPATRQ